MNNSAPSLWHTDFRSSPGINSGASFMLNNMLDFQTVCLDALKVSGGNKTEAFLFYDLHASSIAVCLHTRATEWRINTCFRVDREVWLAVEDAVYHSSTVPIGRVICICGCHLCHICPCGKEREDTLALNSFVPSWGWDLNSLRFISERNDLTWH